MSAAAHRFDNTLRYRDGDHPGQWHLTPAYVLDPVRLDLGGRINLDPCTEPDNPVGADRFYTVEDDGLAQTVGADDVRRLPTEVAASPVDCDSPRMGWLADRLRVEAVAGSGN